MNQLNTQQKLAFKAELKHECIHRLVNRIANISAAIDNAQQSANAQEKSTAGDKHETARAIYQAEREMNAVQLQKAAEDLAFLEKINIDLLCETIKAGAVFSVGGKYIFVATGLGTVLFKALEIMVISVQSPLFMSLQGKRQGDHTKFLNKEEEITLVY